MNPLDSYLYSVRKSLDVRGDAEREAIIAEIRDHILKTAYWLKAEGLDESVAIRRAIARMGDSQIVAAAVSTSYEPSRPLFPARDMIPSSIFWGVWAGAALAGANYIRLGFRSRGVRLIALGIACQLVVWLVIWLFSLLINPPEWRTVLSTGIAWAVNGAAGYWLYTTQREFYHIWRRRNPAAAKKTPYVAWWISLLAVVGAIVVIVLVFVLLLRH